MASSNKKILICDDDAVILKLLEVNLELEGYEVITARNGEEAVRLAKSELPDLIILDIMMPKMDGYQACNHIKSNEATKHIPVIFLSAKAQHSDIERGAAYGVEAYMTKPFDPNELLDVVESLTDTE